MLRKLKMIILSVRLLLILKSNFYWQCVLIKHIFRFLVIYNFGSCKEEIGANFIIMLNRGILLSFYCLTNIAGVKSDLLFSMINFACHQLSRAHNPRDSESQEWKWNIMLSKLNVGTYSNTQCESVYFKLMKKFKTASLLRLTAHNIICPKKEGASTNLVVPCQ